MHFTYEIGTDVVIDASNEQGQVIGRAEYATCENNYLIRYKSADGRAVESWWGESAISVA